MKKQKYYISARGEVIQREGYYYPVYNVFVSNAQRWGWSATDAKSGELILYSDTMKLIAPDLDKMRERIAKFRAETSYKERCKAFAKLVKEAQSSELDSAIHSYKLTGTEGKIYND